MDTRKLFIASLFTGVLAASAAVPVVADAAPSAIQNHIDKGYAALSAGDGDAAAALFTKAIELRSLDDLELATVLVNRGLAYQTRTQYQRAIDDYSAALRLARLPSAAKAATLYNRGLAYQKLARPHLAIDDFTSALFVNSGLAHAYYSRANALRDTGQYLFALGDYEKAARYGYPEAHLPLYGQAVTYTLLKRPQHARQFLLQALALKSDFTAAQKKLEELTAGETAIVAHTDAPQPDSGPFFDLMTNRIDEIVAASLSPIPADRVVRYTGVKSSPLPPRQLLEAAEQVEFATIVLPQHRSVSLAQIPNAMSPAFVISDRQVFVKDQERIASAGDANDVTIEPVSAPAALAAKEIPPPETDMVPPAADPPPLSGWLVQVNSQRNEGAAWSAWSKIQSKHAKLLSVHSAVVQKHDLGSDGVVFRLRIKDLATRSDAASLCGKLKKRGQDCYVTQAGT